MNEFPPATARVLFVTCKDFPDDQDEFKRLFFYRGECLTDPEVYFAAKYSHNLEDVACEETVFRRTLFQANGRTYPFYISRENFDFVVPIIQGIIDEQVRKGKDEYEWKLKQKENEVEGRLKYLGSIAREFENTKLRLEETMEALKKIESSRSYRFMLAIENFKFDMRDIWQKLKSFYKYRIRIVRVEKSDLE